MNLDRLSPFHSPSGPVLCAVIDVQDFNIVLSHAIHHNVGQARQNQLPCALFTSAAAAVGCGT